MAKLWLTCLAGLISGQMAVAEFYALETSDLSLVQAGASCWLEDPKANTFALSDGVKLVVKIDGRALAMTPVDPLFSGENKAGVLNYNGFIDGKILYVELERPQAKGKTWTMSTPGLNDKSIGPAKKAELVHRCGD